jgi:hypothetical protein
MHKVYTIYSYALPVNYLYYHLLIKTEDSAISSAIDQLDDTSLQVSAVDPDADLRWRQSQWCIGTLEYAL